MSIPDNLIPIDNPFKDIDIEVLKQNASIPKFDIPTAPNVNIMPNPIHETNRILEDQNEKINELSDKLESANAELKSIHYENLKCNAQIEVLNKTIDSQTDELEQLRNINAELKTSNKILTENNKHYWRNTILVSLSVGMITFILGMFSTEVKELLLSVL